MYLVEPRAYLEECCRSEPGLWDCLSEASLWTNEEGGQTKITPEDGLSLIKILILGYYFQDFDQLPKLLGTPDFSVATFDRFWKLKRFEPEQSISGLRKDVGDYVAARFEVRSNSRTDQWIKEYLTKAEGM